MKYIFLLISFIFTHSHFACVQLSNKFDTDGFVKKNHAQNRIHEYSVYFPSEINGAKASYAYIYLEENNQTIMTTVSKVNDAYDLYEHGLELYNANKSLNITINEKYTNGVTIQVHYEKPVKDKHTVSCGPVRRYKLNQLSEREL